MEYLPLLSSVLLSEGLISAPIEAVIRKGKAHYACDARLERRVRQVEGSHKNPAARQALHTAWHVLDLDQLSGMSSYDRERICVPKRCNCRRKDCRYRCFLDACQSGQYTVQVCNHNLLLADLIHRSQKKKPILPDSAAIIIDEAHKLPETARQMFGVTLNAQDFAELIRSLHVERYVLAAELLSEAVVPLTEKLSVPVEEGAGFDAYQMFLERPHQILTVICRQLEGLLTRETWRLLSAVASTVSLFYLGNPEMIFYAADDDHGGAMLCGTVSELAAQLQTTLWRQDQPIILTSGTLAVGKDFSRFRTATGLTGERSVTETVCPSPFDYQHNCLLYLPPDPIPLDAADYYDRLAAQIRQLAAASHGHALVLFTSYLAMSAVKERLQAAALPFPVFTMGRRPGPHPGGISRRSRQYPAGHRCGVGGAGLRRRRRVPAHHPAPALRLPGRCKRKRAGGLPEPAGVPALRRCPGNADQTAAGLWPGHPNGNGHLCRRHARSPRRPRPEIFPEHGGGPAGDAGDGQPAGSGTVLP